MPSATSSGTSASAVSATGKKRGRGSYNCGRCGLPKKGHICHIPAQPAESAITPSTAPRSVVVSRRALSFDEDVVEVSNLTRKVEVGEEGGEMVGEIRRSSLVDVMRRLPPKELMIVAGVCKGWRDCVRRVWKSTTGLRLLVPAKAQIGFVGSVLQRCGDLISLSLRMERLEFSDL